MDFADYRSEPTIGRRLLARVVKPTCRLLMRRLNSLEVHGLAHIEAARASDRPLITFSNHVSLFDDPWLPGAVVEGPWESLRWCATDDVNFFSHPLTRRFFSAGKGVPVVRGAGGIITGWKGEPVQESPRGRVIAAATQELHAEALETLRHVA